MIRWQFTSMSAKALVGKPHDRTGAAKALVEGFGGKLDSYYLALGEYDGVAICEFPDNKAAVACSMSATATGGFFPLRDYDAADRSGSRGRDEAGQPDQDRIQAAKRLTEVGRAASARGSRTLMWHGSFDSER
jgi:uncharacterized protein with GYD domain